MIPMDSGKTLHSRQSQSGDAMPLNAARGRSGACRQTFRLVVPLEHRLRKARCSHPWAQRTPPCAGHQRHRDKVRPEVAPVLLEQLHHSGEFVFVRALQTPTTPRPASASTSTMTPTVRLSFNYCT